jgi:aldose 1-epimerase
MRKNQACLEASLFGVTPLGESVEKITLINSLGMKVQFIDYACTILCMDVEDKKGDFKNVVLNLPDLNSYIHTQRRFAAVMGRYAGRIDGGVYTLNGVTHQLPVNSSGIALHGDPRGFDRRVWRRKDFQLKHSMGSVYSLTSPDGDQGHPGNVIVTVTYELMKRKNEFRMSYHASTDQPTFMTLTNHAYFNLAGAGTAGLASHLFQINADQYLQTDEKKIPSGRLLSVNDTPLDLRVPTEITSHLKTPSSVLGDPPEFDHTMVLSKHNGRLRVAAKVMDQKSARTMQIKTTEPAIQFYTGNGFNKNEIGAEGVAYDKFDGFAMETFHFPDSPNQPHFPSALITPTKPLNSKTILIFDLEVKDS